MENRNIYISLISPYIIHNQSIFNPMTPEIRFTITEKLDKILKEVTDKYGVDKSDYVRSLILNDLREKGVTEKKNGK